MNAHFDDGQRRFGGASESFSAVRAQYRDRCVESPARASDRYNDNCNGTAPASDRDTQPAGKAEEKESSAGASQRSRRAGRKVLIADDNRDSAESIAMIFRIYGHAVEVVYDGEAAVRTFAAFEPDFVLLDIGMPKLNGYEAAKRIRAAAGTRPVTLVALTGWGQQSDKERAFAAGFNHHFTKPVDPEMLGELITG